MKKNIAIFIHTFIRDEMMYRCIQSIKRHVPNGRIYLTDGGLLTDEKEKFYEELKAEGHYVEVTEIYNYSWRQAFNDKLKKLQDEEFILKMDDDFILNENCNISKLERFLIKDENVGIIGGEVLHLKHQKPAWYVFDIKQTGPNRYLWSPAEQKDEGYIFCDVIPDFWLARREVFDVEKMDGKRLAAQGGHEEFFLRIYKNRMKINSTFPWRIAYTKEVQAQHEKSGQTKEYYHERHKNHKDYMTELGIVLTGKAPW